MRGCGLWVNVAGRAVLAIAVLLIATAGAARSQFLSPGTSKGLDSYGWAPPTTFKLPTLSPSDTTGFDYFGPATNQQFSEKTLFPKSGNSGPNSSGDDLPKTLGPDGKPVLPPPDPAVMIPDGSLPVPPKPPKIWKGGVEFGINGNEGNSDVVSLRFAANADRKTDSNLFHIDLLYAFTNQDGTTKQNQAFLNARDEILFKGTPWSIFSALQVEYDELRAYDLRAGVYTGLSYLWLKDSTTLFKTRLGFGVVREVDTVAGGSPDRWVPEAVIGDDFNYRFTDRQGFVSGMDIYPNLSQLGQFRVRARAGYEILIDPTHGLVLRLGIQERYDSSPGDAKRNDFSYFTSLMLKF